MKYTLIPLLALALFACDGQPQKEETKEEQTQAEPKEDMATPQESEESKTILVTMETSMGDISIELDSTRAPQTVQNFLAYVDAGFYDGTIFHRVIDGFMIQGGGFGPDGVQKPTRDPIFLESQNGLENEVGTIAMARTNAPNSATAQFFINLKDNDFLNYAPGNPGYAVFGKVVSGMDVVSQIKGVKTGTFQAYRDWPVEPVVIKSVKRD